MLKKIRFILLFLYLFVLSSFSHAQEFSGSEECAACHQEAYDNWQQSHHRHAMEVASSESVLGDFANASFDYLGR